MSWPALIDPGFMFSQHSLNTYVQCPRRFLLQYVDRQPWPVLCGEDQDAQQEHLARGRLFHLWLVRQQLGIDMEPLVAASQDEQLRRWWDATRYFDWERLPAHRQTELAVVVPLGDYRLYARYDLVAWSSDEAVIVDWKTLSTRPPDSVMQSRMQTRVYLYTLARAGAVALGSTGYVPEQLSMVYWFAEYPQTPAVVRYSDADLARDHDLLISLTQQIAQQPREAFVPTGSGPYCARCNYRGWCGEAAGKQAGSPDGDVSDWDKDLDFDLDTAPELCY